MMSTQVWPRRIRTGLYWLLATSFVMGALTKFWPGPTFFGPAYADKFEEWGYPSWFRIVVGSIELVCAVLLLVPGKRFRFIAAAALVLLLVGANTTHIVAGSEIYERTAAPTLMLILTGVALANWPADWKDLIGLRQPNTHYQPCG